MARNLGGAAAAAQRLTGAASPGSLDIGEHEDNMFAWELRPWRVLLCVAAARSRSQEAGTWNHHASIWAVVDIVRDLFDEKNTARGLSQIVKLSWKKEIKEGIQKLRTCGSHGKALREFFLWFSLSVHICVWITVVMATT